MLMVLARPSPIMLRLCVQFKVCCGAFGVESCRENTVCFLTLPCLIFAQKRKGAASIPFKARICFQDVHCFSPCVHGREPLPSSCGASTSAMYATWNSSVRLWDVLEMCSLAFKVCRVPRVIAIPSVKPLGSCL